MNSLYHFIVLLHMETKNVPDRSNNSSVSTGLQNVMDRYETDQKAIRYNGNIVQVIFYERLMYLQCLHYRTRNLQKQFQKRNQIIVENPRSSNPFQKPSATIDKIAPNFVTDPSFPLCGHHKGMNPYLRRL